ncbi:hypothetical protein ACFX14_006494 [Malus domestica]
MAKQIFYINDPKVGRGWKVVQKIEHIGVYDIWDQDPIVDDDYGDVADQQLETSMALGADTLWDMTIVQEPYQVAGGPEIKIPIDSSTIDLGDLPCYNTPKRTNDDVDVPIDDEEWESEFDDNDDHHSSSDED